MINSKQLQVGNEAEKIVQELFKQYGYWAYITPKGKDGSQPVDIIAMKANSNWLVDVKHVRTEEVSFPFNRIEANQITSMDYAYNFSNIKKVGFAIYFERINRCVYMPYIKYLDLKKNGRKSVNVNELYSLEAYLK